MDDGLLPVLGASPAALNVEAAVRERYSAASRATEPALCCPVNYDSKYLAVLPAELIERDYGCGDPSQHVTRGDVVLDLGSGGGKICYIASQIVGPEGRVIGVDINDDMLALARKFQREIGDRIGWHNVDFRRGRIQDLALAWDAFDAEVARANPRSTGDWLALEERAEELRRTQPLVASDSVSVVISNCVLNLVRPADRRQQFAEMFRVLRPGGRAAISDIVCDQRVPPHLQHDPRLWSGCLSGAFLEHEFMQAFEAAGFYGVELVSRQAEPWAVVEGIEFRSVTVRAHKGQSSTRLDGQRAVIYKGPWKTVTDDAGHMLARGMRTPVSGEQLQAYTNPPYAGQLIPVERPGAVSPASCCEPGKCC